MSKPKRQHFIPRSYLNNFSSESEDEKFFIYTKNKSKDEINRFSTKDICVNKDLYTIRSDDESKKYILEQFYADKIDSVYPEIYNILTDDNVLEIDYQTRTKIISVALSLYFRTPKFLAIHNKTIVNALEAAISLKKNTDLIRLNFFGKQVEFKKHELEGFKKEIKEKNRVAFLLGHLEIYEEFINYKLQDGIGITKLIDDSEFITSDNPVIIRNSKSHYGSIFDPLNIISLPLNNKYLLQILPKKESALEGSFLRIEGDYTLSSLHNHDTERHAELWIIGNKESLIKHMINQSKFSSESVDFLKMEENIKQKSNLLNELMKIIEEEGMSPKAISFVNMLKYNPLMSEDSNFKRNLELLREKGYEV